MVLRLIKLLLFLAIICGIGLVVYAYLGPMIFPADFAPPTQSQTQPVTLTVE